MSGSDIDSWAPIALNYYLDDVLIGGDAQSLSFTISDGLKPGIYQLAAVVTDAGGLSRNSAPLRIFLSNRPVLSVFKETDGSWSLTAKESYGSLFLQSSPDMRPSSWTTISKSSGPGQAAILYSGFKFQGGSGFFRLIGDQLSALGQ